MLEREALDLKGVYNVLKRGRIGKADLLTWLH